MSANTPKHNSNNNNNRDNNNNNNSNISSARKFLTQKYISSFSLTNLYSTQPLQHVPRTRAMVMSQSPSPITIPITRL